MGKKLLTLNIGASSVTLAEYDAGGKSLTLLKYGKANLAAPLDSGNVTTILAPALHEIMRTKGIKPGKVSISISGQMAFLRNAAIPFAGGQDRFDTLVRYEIEQNIPFPIDEMVCDSHILGDTVTGDKSVIIVASKVDQIENLVAAVKSVGFDPEVIDVAPISLINLLQASPTYEGGCAVILDIGAKTTSLSIIEGEKIYNRAIPVAGNTITKEIAQTVGCSIDEAENYKCQNAYVSMGGVTEDEDETLDRVSKVCRSVATRLHAEITRSINFYRSQQGGATPAKLYLTGGTALLPQLADFFQDSLQIEVAFLNPFDAISVAAACQSPELEYDSVYLSATTGLAFRAAERASIAINLLPPSITLARKEAKRIPFVAIGSVSLVAAAVFCYFSQANELEALRSEEESLSAELSRLDGIENNNKKAIEKFEAEKGASLALAKNLIKRDAYLKRIETVREAIEGDMWIAKWDEKSVTVKTEEPKAQTSRRGRGRARQQPVEQRTEVVTTVTIRGWRDQTQRLAEKESESTIADLLKKRLEKTGAFATNGVEIVGAPTIGRKSSLQQVELNLKFEEPKWK